MKVATYDLTKSGISKNCINYFCYGLIKDKTKVTRKEIKAILSMSIQDIRRKRYVGYDTIAHFLLWIRKEVDKQGGAS